MQLVFLHVGDPLDLELCRGDWATPGALSTERGAIVSTEMKR